MVYASTIDLADAKSADSTMLLALASSAVDDEVGRPLAEASYTETFEPGRVSRFWLVAPDWPADVDAVVEDGVTLDAADYAVSADGALVRVGGLWSGEVAVTYTTGFAAGSRELETAKRIVLQLASMAAANPQGLASIGVDGVTPSFVTSEGSRVLPPVTLSEAQRRELEPLRWRRKRV